MENTATPREASPALDRFVAVDAHIASRMPAHTLAFAGPVVRSYHPGQIVLLWDHYNTATIVGPGVERDTWTVTTTDADGSTDRLEYLSAHIRPTAAPVEFRWAPDVCCGCGRCLRPVPCSCPRSVRPVPCSCPRSVRPVPCSCPRSVS